MTSARTKIRGKFSLPIVLACLSLALSGAAFAHEIGRPDTVRTQYGNTPHELEPYSGGVSTPYRRFFREPLEYLGPGREKPEPDVDTVWIGVLAPLERTHERYIGQSIAKACRLAVDEANLNGGFRGKPFGLVVRNDNGLWGASANEIATFSYDDNVWAIIGSVDGANTHIAIRVALKTEVPMMNVGDTDPTLVETKIPWVFRNIADDRQMCYTLAYHLFHDRGFQRVAILRANNRYGRFGVAEFRHAAVRFGTPVPIEINYDMRWADLDSTFALQIDRVKRINPEAIVLWGDAEPAGHLVRRLREEGCRAPIYASDRIIHPDFARIAGTAAEGVVATSTYDPTDNNPALRAFQRDYAQRFGEEPDAYSAHAFDGTNMVIDAIRQAGLNRYRIRDALAAMRTYDGVTGRIEMDEAYSDRSPVTIATFRSGRWHYGIPTLTRRF